MVANPTDLVKVRLQAEGKLAAGAPRRYSGALNAYSTIVRQVVIPTWKLRLCISCFNSTSYLINVALTGRSPSSLDWSWT